MGVTVAEARGNRTHPRHLSGPRNGFEDREGHQSPFASGGAQTMPPPSPSRQRGSLEAGPGGSQRETGSLRLRSRSEFVTTLTDEKAMAKAAIIGLSSPMAATGMPTQL